jgi:hypothetical protein
VASRLDISMHPLIKRHFNDAFKNHNLSIHLACIVTNDFVPSNNKQDNLTKHGGYNARKSPAPQKRWKKRTRCLASGAFACYTMIACVF